MWPPTRVSSMKRRGQAGIGTLVMFVALVTVAAIAGGALLGGANAIRLQAEDETESTIADIGTGLTVVNEVGRVNDDGESVRYVRLSVKLGSGTNESDLRNATIHYTDDDTTATLNFTNQTANATNFTVAAPVDTDDSAPVLNDETDTFHIFVAVEAIRAGVEDGPAGITWRTNAGLTIVTEDDMRTTVTLTPPAALEGKQWVGV